MNRTPLPPDSSSPASFRRGLWGLALVLLFLLLAWGIWWFFDYKIRSLDAVYPP